MSAELHPSAASMSSNTSVLLLITLWASVQEGECFLQGYLIKEFVFFTLVTAVFRGHQM